MAIRHIWGQYQIARAMGVEAYFLTKVSKLPNGCWEWTGRLKTGYGVFMISRINAFAHRWAYQHWIATVPDGLHLDHYRFPQDGCIGPACCNPGHVRPVTPRENTLRGNTITALNASKTHCSKGHPFEGDNLYVDPRGRRRCRTCRSNETPRSRRSVRLTD